MTKQPITRGYFVAIRRRLNYPLMPAPDSSTIFPLAGYQRLCFLKNLVHHPRITVGDYTYYDDFETAENFLRQVRCLFSFTGDHLHIGKFCMVASGVSLPAGA